MSKHTPGPWESQCFAVYAPNHDLIAQTGIVGNQFGAEQNKANAKLIAAAPELLELANRLASECAECDGRGFVYGDDGVSGRGPDDIEPTRIACAECDDIRAVIAKATSHS